MNTKTAIYDEEWYDKDIITAVFIHSEVSILFELKKDWLQWQAADSLGNFFSRIQRFDTLDELKNLIETAHSLKVVPQVVLKSTNSDLLPQVRDNARELWPLVLHFHEDNPVGVNSLVLDPEADAIIAWENIIHGSKDYSYVPAATPRNVVEAWSDTLRDWFEKQQDDAREWLTPGDHILDLSSFRLATDGVSKDSGGSIHRCRCCLKDFPAAWVDLILDTATDTYKAEPGGVFLTLPKCRYGIKNIFDWENPEHISRLLTIISKHSANRHNIFSSLPFRLPAGFVEALFPAEWEIYRPLPEYSGAKRSDNDRQSTTPPSPEVSRILLDIPNEHFIIIANTPLEEVVFSLPEGVMKLSLDCIDKGESNVADEHNEIRSTFKLTRDQQKRLAMSDIHYLPFEIKDSVIIFSSSGHDTVDSLEDNVLTVDFTVDSLEDNVLTVDFKTPDHLLTRTAVSDLPIAASSKRNRNESSNTETKISSTNLSNLVFICSLDIGCRSFQLFEGPNKGVFIVPQESEPDITLLNLNGNEYVTILQAGTTSTYEVAGLPIFELLNCLTDASNFDIKVT
ncbi:MAG: hypothetical protein ABW148_17720 [Sedimenticola sp.]